MHLDTCKFRLILISRDRGFGTFLSNPYMADKRIRNRLIIGVIAAILVAALAWLLTTAIPKAASSEILDDQSLEAKALQWARIHGLQGDPIAKRVVRITLSQWLALEGTRLAPSAAQYGLSPNTPVLVLAIRGRVEGQIGLGSPLPGGGQAPPEQFDNITVVIDARNGNPLSVETMRDLSKMPIPVPLNALTPTAPITFPAMQPLVTPPTQPPKATLTPTLPPSALPTPTLR